MKPVIVNLIEWGSFYMFLFEYNRLFDFIFKYTKALRCAPHMAIFVGLSLKLRNTHVFTSEYAS